MQSNRTTLLRIAQYRGARSHAFVWIARKQASEGNQSSPAYAASHKNTLPQTVFLWNLLLAHCFRLFRDFNLY